MRRVAAMGDGWFPQMPPADAGPLLELLWQYTREAGRSRDDIGLEARLNMNRIPREQWGNYLQEWRDLGATHLAINTMGLGLKTPQDHIDAITQFAEEHLQPSREPPTSS